MSGLKKEVVTVPAWPDNRDAGSQFLLTEMPAGQAEKWAVRAVLVIENSGQTIPQDVQGLGMVGIAILGFNIFLRGNINPEKLFPLMDEMMTCVKKIRDPQARDKMTGEVIATDLVSDDDIRDVKTRLWLKSEVLRLHTGFSLAAAVSSLISVIKANPENSSSI